ncbi:MAG TPA: ankyrin repeat domain-containing protein, partial [Burkholderiaceae bacterium]|nr:ankyrin repeat domain-containing protein [Burkholderiaceae bacterium]
MGDIKSLRELKPLAAGITRRLALIGTSVITLPRAGAAWAQAATNPNLNAQLLVAARNNDLASVQRALADGAAPNSRNRLGKTALLMACEKGQAPLASTMLRAGTDVNLASLEGVTPLMAASYGGHAAIARELLRAGARTDGSDRMHKNAWVYAAAQGHAEVVGLLLD